MDKTALVYLTLFVISLGYNWLVGSLERKNKLAGIKAILVLGGCTYTITLSAYLIGRDAALVIGGAFFFALIPMVAGEVWRRLDENEEFARLWEDLAREARQRLGKEPESEQ